MEAAGEARTLRCPLCCQVFIVHSEQECQAHIASCTAFRAEYGASAARAGLADAAELDEQRCLAAFVLATVARADGEARDARAAARVSPKASGDPAP